MSPNIGLQIAIIVILILANGFFAASEIAIVSARRNRLQQQADAGKRAAKQAIELAEHSDRFLATVQLGVTLISTFAAAFGGASIGDALAKWLETFPSVAPYAQTLALVLVVVPLTYLSLVVGELAPKRLALLHAERIAMFAAPIMAGIARIARPLVLLLTFSANVILGALGQRKARENTVTEADIIYIAQDATLSGTVEPAEAQFIRRVFQFTDRRVNAVMTPRLEIVAIEVKTPLAEVVQEFVSSGYSRLPVYEDKLDTTIGVLYSKDVLRALSLPEQPPLRQLLHTPLFVPEHQRLKDVLATFRRQSTHVALVSDEYGQVSGLVTMEDLLEELVGEIQDEYDTPEDRPIVQRDDGSWLVDGAEAYESVRAVIPLPPVPHAEEGQYTTLAGFLLARLGKIPQVGETTQAGPYLLEVVDMDGRRIDRVLVRPKPEEQPKQDG
jgi:putative hemolysin